MTDPELIRKKLAFIETCLRELRDLARPDRIDDDLRERRFVEHTLQIAIQAALDVASHIVSSERYGEPRTNHELFTLMERHGWVSSELGASLRRMAGFRNILVHGYTEVDAKVIVDIVAHRLVDLEQFTSTVRARLPRAG